MTTDIVNPRKKLEFYNSTLYPNQSNILLQQACPITGIITLMLVPTVLESLNLEVSYRSVFAELVACKKLLNLSNESLLELNNDILAGVFLTVGKSLDLVVYKDDPIAVNAMLSTADKQTLINAVQFISKIKQHKADLLPKINLDYATHKEGYKKYTPILVEHLKVWNDELVALNLMQQANKGILSKASIEYFEESTVKNSIPSNTKSDHLKGFLVEFKDLKSKAVSSFKPVKTLLLDFKRIKLAKFLDNAIRGENMLHVAKDTKEKLVERLEDLQDNVPLDYEVDIQNLIAFIKYSENDEIGESKVLDALDKASDIMAKPTAKTTIQELLLKARARQAEGK